LEIYLNVLFVFYTPQIKFLVYLVFFSFGSECYTHQKKYVKCKDTLYLDQQNTTFEKV